MKIIRIFLLVYLSLFFAAGISVTAEATQNITFYLILLGLTFIAIIKTYKWKPEKKNKQKHTKKKETIELSMKCPTCGAPIQYTQNKKQKFVKCEYCDCIAPIKE